MSSLINLTPHSASQSIGHDVHGFWQVTVSVKATFTWDDTGKAVSLPAVPLLQRHDTGGVPGAGIRYPAEVSPPKPRIDVLLAGALVFPIAVEQVDVVLAVGSRLRKVVRVFGDRVWEPGLLGDVAPSKPRRTSRVPILWERSFGGTDPENPALTDRRNPVGTGVASRPDSLAGRPAPSFEAPEHPIASWKDRPAPVGFGAVAEHWEPRTALAGTYDEAWKVTRWPLPPADFDTRFFNLAPRDQQLDGYIADEEVQLKHMTAAGKDRFRLPRLEVPVTFETRDELIHEVAAVDTVVIEPAERRFAVIARAAARLLPDAVVLRRAIIGEAPRRGRPAARLPEVTPA